MPNYTLKNTLKKIIFLIITPFRTTFTINKAPKQIESFSFFFPYKQTPNILLGCRENVGNEKKSKHSSYNFIHRKHNTRMSNKIQLSFISSFPQEPNIE